MNATSDYAAARAFLKPHLPAYVTYTIHSRASFDAVVKDETRTLTVRTSDGKIVKGKAPDVKVDSSNGDASEATDHPPFDANCYSGAEAQAATYDGRSLEAIALTDRCKTDKHSDTDFQTLYVDPKTYAAVAVVGVRNDGPVAVSLDQRFLKTQGYVMPASFHIHVKGSGLMFWLDVLADQTYSDYRFSDTIPR